MVLEPIAPPKVGQALNLLAALGIGAAVLVQVTVNSVSGFLPLSLLAGLLACAFLARFVGLLIADARGQWTMPWTARFVSWILIATASVMIAIIGASRVVLLAGAFIAIDAATGFVKREAKPKPARASRSLWSRIKLPLFATLYLGFVAAFHFLVGVYLPYGVLVTWSLLSLGFVVLLRGMLVGEKADEAWLRAPADHRLHERREENVIDPQRARADDVLHALRARGDASGFLEFVRTAAKDADLAEADVEALEARILSSLARAGTRRDEDVATALAEVERSLSPRKEIRPT